MYQELNDGYQSNPTISSVSEIAGSALAPIKVHTPRGESGGNTNTFYTVLFSQINKLSTF
jgi:hypothetical protein